MSMQSRLMREVAELRLPPVGAPGRPITELHLEGLPEPVQRYLRFMGVVGRPRDGSFRIGFKGRFRRSPRERWMPCQAWQYSQAPGVVRIFHIRIRFAGLVPVLGRDTYVGGRGRMLIRLLDLKTLGDGTGEGYDIGELTTYLNDAVFLAPSFLMVPAVRFTAVDATSFDVSLSDRGRTVRARVSIDDRGAPVDFSTTDRFCADAADPAKLVQARWTTPVEGWRDVDGRRLWTSGRAIWHLPEGDFAYAELAPIRGSLEFGVEPGVPK